MNPTIQAAHIVPLTTQVAWMFARRPVAPDRRLAVLTVDQLVALEETKMLKARYCRAMDAKDWAAYRELYTDDAHLDVGQPDKVYDPDSVAAILPGMLPVRTAHVAHNPIIEFTSETTATGHWGSFFAQEGHRFTGWGEYDEEYRREPDGRWRFTKLVYSLWFAEGTATEEVDRLLAE